MIARIIDYIGIDGMLHIICSMILVSVIAMLLPSWAAIVITLTVGISKELVWDLWLSKGSASWKDLLCDLLGILIGLI